MAYLVLDELLLVLRGALRLPLQLLNRRLAAILRAEEVLPISIIFVYKIRYFQFKIRQF